jgi:hypothetical protein
VSTISGTVPMCMGKEMKDRIAGRYSMKYPLASILRGCRFSFPFHPHAAILICDWVGLTCK